MSKFYTCVNQYGNRFLHRGYDEYGNRVAYKIKFEPVLYVPTSKRTGLFSIDGTELEERQFDSISHAREFVDQYQGVDNFPIYGNQTYLAQYILSIHPDDIQFNKEKVNITTIDIEVDSSDGFPHPDQAAYEVISIALHHTVDDTYYVFGLKDYDVEKSIVRDTNRVVYHKCKDEVDLLQNFLSHWSLDKTSPDVVTGWNIRAFDIPYMINRITKVLGDKSAQRMSPWNIIKNSSTRYKNKTLETYEIFGIQQLDYLDIFQKFTANTLGAQESYKLDHIAHVVLGENKLSYEEHSTLANLYVQDPQKFLDYNIKDVQLVQRLEDKLGLIGLVMTMAYRGGVNYTTTLGTTAIWDSILYRDLASKNLIVPPAERKAKGAYAGAYVKEPHVGMHNWVASFDLNSLYPSIIVQWNMSPETLIPGLLPLDVDKCLKEEIPNLKDKTTVAANGAQFKTDKEGVIPTIVKTIYAERRIMKSKMLEAEQRLELADKSDKQLIYSIERDISIYKTQQMALKILLNSLYGALGNAYFRYTNLTVAEAITTTGQMVIKWIERDINKKMDSILSTVDNDYVIAIDTDSVVGNTIISVNGNNIKIEDYYDSVQGKMIKNDTFNENYVKEIDNGDLTDSISENGILESKPINYIMKHKVKKEMFRITNSLGQSVIVTEDHSIIVRNKRSKKISSIKPHKLSPKNHEIINIIANDTDSVGGNNENNRRENEEYI